MHRRGDPPGAHQVPLGDGQLIAVIIPRDMPACDAVLMKLPSAYAGGNFFHALKVSPDRGHDRRSSCEIIMNFIDMISSVVALWPVEGGSGRGWHRFACFQKRLKISSLFHSTCFRLPQSMA